MSSFTDEEDRALVQLAIQQARNGQKRISWITIAKTMSTKKSPEQLRLRLAGLKKRFGNELARFPRWYHIQKLDQQCSKQKVRGGEPEIGEMGSRLVQQDVISTQPLLYDTSLIDLFRESESSDDDIPPTVQPHGSIGVFSGGQRGERKESNTAERTFPSILARFNALINVGSLLAHEKEIATSNGLQQELEVVREREKPANGEPAVEVSQVWRRRLVEAYSAIRKSQKTAEKLVLGHQHMYAELTQASLVQLLQILRWDCDLNSDSVFVDLGCGLGKVVYLASVCGVRKSLGIEIVPEHLKNARLSMKKLKAKNVEFIEGDIMDNLHKLGKVTHLYAFDFVFSEQTMSAIYGFLRKYKNIYLASFRKPAAVKRHLNVNVVQVLKGRMTHVRESHNCYIYKIV
jgi:hypothetical protein